MIEILYQDDALLAVNKPAGLRGLWLPLVTAVTGMIAFATGLSRRPWPIGRSPLAGDASAVDPYPIQEHRPPAGSYNKPWIA